MAQAPKSDGPPPRRNVNWAGWVGNALAAIALAGGGFAAGHSTTKTKTETVTETDTVTVTVPEEGGGVEPPPVGTVKCADRPGPPGAASDSPGHAAGPIVANKPVAATIRGQNEVHYLALCVSRPAQLTFSIQCTGSDCTNTAAYGEFPTDATLPGEVDVGRPLTCDVKAAGRYTLVVRANVRPSSYVLTVHTRTPDAVVSSIPADRAPPDPESACG